MLKDHYRCKEYVTSKGSTFAIELVTYKDGKGPAKIEKVGDYAAREGAVEAMTLFERTAGFVTKRTAAEGEPLKLEANTKTVATAVDVKAKTTAKKDLPALKKKPRKKKA